MARSMVDGATSSLTLAIGPATRTRAGVLTAEDYLRIQGIGETNAVLKNGCQKWQPRLTPNDTRWHAMTSFIRSSGNNTMEKILHGINQ